ncbi:MAG TPA: acyl-CoA carboxylase subunit beta [Bacteroidales bacterium]|jgi:acetyl-CoA carboxylase carboxyltransferase component|nr:acyl-CoA carboxylase subunit beta [Bacteroidales bacterium]HOS71047.1 acyl-CoA carboxylase subunit beta [Bacteroidales bacterium]HQH24173.1 acyl-CoA carboxylase subunit beta [Bacteroidales bacterium]HQJ81797.1 acyl-CoA carboxylase subunit beta [Bacteroidales bacterium]
MALSSKIREFHEKREKLLLGGGEQTVEKQKAMGKRTARERISALLDEGSFTEYDLFVKHVAHDFDMGDKSLPGDGVITGTGTIDGSPVAVFAQDFTVAGGSLGLMHSRKITKIMDHALKMRMPLIGINDSGGARIQEGVNSLAGYGEIFFRNTLSSGVIPQISVILGPCAGGAVYSPALTDFVFVVDNISKMFITGPEVIKTVLGEEISMEDLGGARVHSEISGNAHFFAGSEEECFAQIKKLIGFIPRNNTEKAGVLTSAEPLTAHEIDGIVPDDPTLPYDVRDVIKAVADNSDFFEVMENFAGSIVIGFGRIEGRTAGFVANQPLEMAGVLDVDSSDKAARFIRFCDAFNIPVITFVDIPGYLPGADQEHAGLIRHGAKILYSYSEATVPKITVILRKAYGGGYIAMGSRHLRADFVFAWPAAEIAVMGPEGAANIIFRKEIMSSADPEETRRQKIEEYRKKFANPYVAASRGYIDAVIEPSETRKFIAHSLKVSENKEIQLPPKKHGLPPF